MATSKLIVLVTGASNGIGYELVAQLMARGRYHVLLGSRSVEKGDTAVKELQSRNQSNSDAVELLPIDVTNDETIEKAAETVKQRHGKLDMLVNNAGIAGVDITPLRKGMREAFDVNAAGPAVVTKAFGPLIQKSTSTSPSPRIVNVSSGIGSIGRCLDPTSPMYKMQGLQYRCSKAAMNMVCQQKDGRLDSRRYTNILVLSY